MEKNRESVTKYDAIVIASDIAGKFSGNQKQKNYSALIPLHGKPLLDWVIDALRQCERVGKITVIGPESIDELLSFRYIDRRISPSFATLSNLYSRTESTGGYIILPGEAVFLRPDIIESLINAFEKSQSDMGIPCTTPRDYPPLAPHPDTIEWKGKKIVPGVISIVNRNRLIPAAIYKLSQLNPRKGILAGAGVILPAVAAIEISVMEKTALKLNFFDFPHLEVTLSVNSSTDLEYARSTVPKPYHPRFKKVKLIMNPRSGQGLRLPGVFLRLLGIRKRSVDRISNLQDFKDRLIGYLNEYEIYPEISIGKNAEEAEETARRCAAQGYDLVVAAGGDGTINAVINGLVSSDTSFGAIPLGTVNLYALQLKIPMGLRSSCQLLAEGKVCRIDAARANNRHFVCLSGIGFDAFVIKIADNRFKKLLGAAGYILTGLIKLPRYPFAAVKLIIENNGKIIHTKGYTVIIGNGKFYSANITIAPDSRIDDGYLDVIVFKRKNFLSFLRYLRTLTRGELSALEGVEYYRSKRIEITKEGHHPIHLDGEPFGHTPVEYSVIPKALKVIC